MIAHMPDRNRPAYDFSDPVDLKRMAGGDPLFAELVATPAFQRLKSICFLGGIDYLLVPAPNGAKGNIRYTRHQHSLGVARRIRKAATTRTGCPRNLPAPRHLSADHQAPTHMDAADIVTTKSLSH